ncbi:unnamed protein product [Brassica oleracea var. botrytis]
MLWSHPHKPLSFNAKPRSHHWKLQTDGVTSPVLNAPRSSSEGTLRSHALHVLMPVLLELSGSVHISILNLLIKNSLLLFVPTIWEKKNTIARYRVELLVEAGDDKSLFVAFDSAMTKLTGIRAAEVAME